jgi:outer membrane protein OmpA-like peptidoglycan-associated protein
MNRALLGFSTALALALSSPLAHAQVTFGGSASGSASSSAPPTVGAAGGTGAAAAPAPKPSAPSPAAAAAGATEEPQDAEWAERDKAAMESSTLTGQLGLLHTPFAQGSAPGQFRLGFTTEYFSAGFLCTAKFPCPNPAGGLATSDSMDHFGGTISLGVSIVKWLEAYAATSAYGNSSDKNRPSLLQVLGDTDLGLRAHAGLSKIFYLGGFTELWLINGSGKVGLEGGGTSFKLGPVATLDLRGLEKPAPVRMTLALDYMFDNTGKVLKTTEQRRGQPVTRIERFGLGVNRVDHFDIGLGVEVFFAEERVRPFLEYGALIPVNRQGYACHLNNPSSDKCMKNEKLAPQKLTIGSRFLPWKRGFNLTAAFDIGVAGTKTFVEELSPVPPWTLYLGAGWNVDTQDRPPVVKLRTVEKVVDRTPVKLRIRGFVHEKDKPEGIANAIVAYENHPELTSMVSGADGKFLTQDLAEGGYSFLVKADGFKETSCQATITKGGTSEVALDCPLEALPRVGVIVGRIRDAATQSPVSGAVVKVVDSAKKESTLGSDGQGGFRIDQVPPGTATFTVEAEGYLVQVMPADVKPRQDNPVDIMLTPKPKNALVTVGKKEITIKQQIQFAVDSAVILPESQGLMTEIADSMIRNPRIRRVEIQGHTDNSGTADRNQSLSDQRAEAVRTWLVDHGVGPDRMVARGYGQTKPLVPNVTPANKAKNRRVQFMILEQDAAPSVGGGGGGAPAPAAPKPGNPDTRK